jgi:hypothetical protein
MTEKITLELTLEELKHIDNSIGRYNHTAVLKDKIKDAYPLPKMKFERNGKFEIVSYNHKCYVRLDYSYDTFWYISKNVEKFTGNNLTLITDAETQRLLEGLWFNEVKGGKYD